MEEIEVHNVFSIEICDIMKCNGIEKEKLFSFMNMECFRAVTDNINAGILMFDVTGRAVTGNRAFLSITGYDPSEFEGNSVEDVTSVLVQYTEDCAREFQGTTKPLIIKCRQGNIVSVNLSLVPFAEGEVLIVELFHEPLERERQSRRSDKLKSMGELAAVMAHEIRNPLGSIELFASMIKTGMIAGDEITKFSEHILVSVKKLDCLISNLLVFSNLPKPYYTKLNAKQFIEDFFGSLKYLLEQNNIIFRKNFAEGASFIMADREFLKQAFLNLVLNSLQAMPEGGSISIKTFCSIEEDVLPKNYFVIEIADDGCGIPEEVIDKIFNPFFTTKDKKAGIGLSIVNNIIEVHNGIVEVESREKEGTLFRLKIPALITEV